VIIPTPLLVKAAPYAIAVVVGGGWFAANQSHQRAIGRRDEQLRVDKLTIASLKDQASRQTIQYHTDTIRLRETRTHYDTLVARFRETITAPAETIAVPAETVRVIVRAADSTILACGLVVSSCEARLATANELSANYQHQLILTRAAVPSAFHIWAGRVGWLAGGIGVGYILRR